jgi:hypothetical protein
MNITIRSMLEELGISTEKAKEYAREVAKEESRWKRHRFLVQTPSYQRIFYAEDLELEGETPCLVFEIGKGEDNG